MLNPKIKLSINYFMGFSIRHIVVLFVLMFGLLQQSQSQILTFEFSALAGNEATAASNSNDANLGSSTISRGSGLVAASNSGRFNATDWALTSISNAVSGNNYMEFTITPDAGYQFSVSSIYVQLQRSSTGPSGIAIRNSLDSYSTNLDAEYSIVDNTNTQNFTFTFAQANSSTAVTYRIYMWAEATAGSGGIGDGAGNDLIVNGSVSPTVASPDLTVSTATLTAFTYIEGSGPSTSQSFSLTGANMDGTNVVLTAPTNYEISTDNSSFSTSLTLTAYGGGATTIYVRLKSGLAAGDYNGETITVTGGGDAAGETVTCNGTVMSVPQLFISEISPRGYNGDFNNEFIEITNGGSTSVDLTNWTLEYYETGVLEETVNLTGTISANSAYVIAARSTNTLSEDILASFTMSGTSYCILKYNSTVMDQAGSNADQFTDGVNYEFTDCSNDNLPTTNWDNLGATGGTPGVVNCIVCETPSATSSVFVFSTVSYSSMDISWTNGDGSKRIVVAKAGSSVTSNPINGTSYTANSEFGLGDDIGTNEYVVYNGNGNSFSITGLTPGTTYYFELFEYHCSPGSEMYLTTSTLIGNQATLSCTDPSTQATNITFPSVFSTSLTLNWTNGNGAGRIVIISDDATFTNPVDGTDPIADPIYAGSGDQVVYNGTGNSVTVTGLTASTQYWFRVYEYNCSGTNINFVTSTATNNPNSQTTTATPVTTVLEQGDFAIMGVNSNIAACVGGSAGDDEISFVCFKDITTGTSIDFTDNGWQRENANLFGNTEGYYRITRTGGTIAAGTVITIYLKNVSPFFEGVYPDNNWSLDIKTPGSCVLNSNGDQIFFMQGGVWDNGTGVGTHDAFYTGGEFLFAFNTNDSWTDFGTSTQESGLIGGMDCFNMMPSGATDYLKYTGPQTEATQIEWIGRLNDNTNWTSFPAGCVDYYATSPNYETGHNILISTVGVDVVYNWYGNRSTEWFDCANWGPLRVPSAANSVVIPDNINVSNDIVLISGENAACLDFTIDNATYSIKGEASATKVLTVNRDLTINQGIIDFNDGNNATADGTIYVKRNWINNGSTSDFDRGNSTVIFNGSGNQTIYSADMLENFNNLTLVSPSVLIANGSDLNISGTWTNYSAAGFTEGTNLVRFDGTDLQTLSTAGGEVFYNMEIDNVSNLRLDNNLTVSNNLFLKNGNLLLNNRNLILQSSYTRLNGLFSGTTTSNITINGSGALATALMFDAGVENLGNLTINRASSGTVTMGTNLNVYGLLSMAAGELIINDKILGLNGTASGTGTLRGSVNSEISIGGTGVLGTIYFSTGNEELRNLSTNRASGVCTLGTNLSVNNVLTLANGKITTGTNRIHVTNSAANSVVSHNENSYVNGNLRRNVLSSGSYDFPVGTASWYELANINLVSSSGIGYIDAKFVNPHTGTTPTGLEIAGTPITTLLNSGFWTISPDAVTTADYDITLVSRGHTNGGTDPEQHTVVKRNDSSSPWVVDQGVHDNSTQLGTGTAPITAVRTDLSLFSDFAIARSSDFILPVELLSFKGYMLNSSIELIWETASELNNDYFTLEKSNDAQYFSELAIVPGKGTCSDVSSYSFLDEKPLSGANYYRLKQTDFDGTFAYSPIISVKTGNGNDDIQIIQNGDILTVTLPDNSQSQELTIHDITGREIFTTKIYPEKYSCSINLNDLNVTTGLYLISTVSAIEYKTKKIFIN